MQYGVLAYNKKYPCHCLTSWPTKLPTKSTKPPVEILKICCRHGWNVLATWRSGSCPLCAIVRFEGTPRFLPTHGSAATVVHHHWWSLCSPLATSVSKMVFCSRALSITSSLFPRSVQKRLARLQPLVIGGHVAFGTCHTDSSVDGSRVRIASVCWPAARRGADFCVPALGHLAKDQVEVMAIARTAVPVPGSLVPNLSDIHCYPLRGICGATSHERKHTKSPSFFRGGDYLMWVIS